MKFLYATSPIILIFHIKNLQLMLICCRESPKWPYIKRWHSEWPMQYHELVVELQWQCKQWYERCELKLLLWTVLLRVKWLDLSKRKINQQTNTARYFPNHSNGHCKIEHRNNFFSVFRLRLNSKWWFLYRRTRSTSGWLWFTLISPRAPRNLFIDTSSGLIGAFTSNKIENKNESNINLKT